jgi:hypothetical protein
MLTIYRSEGSASLRRVPVWLVDSTGTAPVSAAGLQPQITWLARAPVATVNTAATLSLISANAGLHYVELAASEVSALGIFAVQARSATAIAQTSFGQVVNYDSGDSMRFGQFALPNAAPAVAGGLPTFGSGAGQLNLSGGSVGIVPGILSGVSVEVKATGIVPASVGAGTYSSVTIQGLSNYANISNVTLAAGTHSGATVQGVTRVNSSVTPADATYSAVTVRLETGVSYSDVTIAGVTRVDSSVTIRDATYSAVTVRVTAFGATSFLAGAIDAAALATDAGQEIADRVLLRNIGSGADTGRLVRDAFRAIRNRVDGSSSVMTVYEEDDATSAWTASMSTNAGGHLIELNPAGP